MSWRRYSRQERAQIATEYDQHADGLKRVAAHLESQGHHDAAGIQRRSAQANHEIADAARESSDRLNEVING